MLRHEDLKTRLVTPTVFERLLPYVFNQLNNFLMVLIGTVGQKQNLRLRDLAAKNSRIRDEKKHKKTRFRDALKTPPRFRDWNKIFQDPEYSGYHSPPLSLIHFIVIIRVLTFLNAFKCRWSLAWHRCRSAIKRELLHLPNIDFFGENCHGKCLKEKSF